MRGKASDDVVIHALKASRPLEVLRGEHEERSEASSGQCISVNSLEDVLAHDHLFDGELGLSLRKRQYPIEALADGDSAKPKFERDELGPRAVDSPRPPRLLCILPPKRVACTGYGPPRPGDPVRPQPVRTG